jgi:hypothetical protein
MAKSTVYAMSWVMPKLLLGPMPYLMPWQLLPYATVKIGVNSIADITNGISIGIGNSIVRNNSIPMTFSLPTLISYCHSHIQASTS